MPAAVHRAHLHAGGPDMATVSLSLVLKVIHRDIA